MKRLQMEILLKDLKKKMVMLSGPRQVGKTWLAKSIMSSFKNPLYYNYDNLNHRDIINNMAWPNDPDLIIFDEIHKKPEFKNYLKGVYDTKSESQSILVTGSARLELLRKMGDSLAGRFYSHQLLPFSFKEINKVNNKISFNHYWNRGGFPEPLLGDETTAKLWRQSYYDSLIREDLFELIQIGDFRAIKSLLELLKIKVGAPVSYSSLSEDLHISVPTVKKYIEILEALYLVFRVTPYSKNIARAILKEPKIYFYDFSLIENEGAKLENLVALSLLKHVSFLNDTQADGLGLHYLRTKDAKEVDFCLSKKGNLIELLEVKMSDKNISSNLLYFSEKYQTQGKQLVLNLRDERKINQQVQILKLKEYLLSLSA